MTRTRPHSVKGKWSEGDWAGLEFEFRETLEYLDEPEADIDNVLRSTAERYGHAQDSYSAYLESDYWMRVRGQAIHAANNQCKCGETEGLQVHHRSYCARYTEHLNMHLLEVVCLRCHAQAHGEDP
jgi:hypothetical protein